MDCISFKLSGKATSLFVFLVMATSAFGIILQNGSQPTYHPNDAVIGAWASNASCVAIAPNYILTCRHQGGGVGTEIKIGGETYKVAEIINNPYQEILGTTVDMRVARLETLNGQPVNLDNYVSIYTGTKEVRKTVLLGGYGDGADGVYPASGEPYGYEWDNSSNTTLRWGTNIIDSTQSYSNGSYYSKGLKCDFDELGQFGATEFEAAVADHDSGGGWFIEDNGEWKLVGLSAYVETIGYSLFANSSGFPDPDWQGCIRVSSYSSWIEENISSVIVLPGDANWDGAVDVADLGILAANYGGNGLTWQDGDFNADGLVDVGDLGILAANYGSMPVTKFDEANLNFVPEPITAILFLTGVWCFHGKSR